MEARPQKNNTLWWVLGGGGGGKINLANSEATNEEDLSRIFSHEMMMYSSGIPLDSQEAQIREFFKNREIGFWRENELN